MKFKSRDQYRWERVKLAVEVVATILGLAVVVAALGFGLMGWVEWLA